jgi:hypothetical protein
MDFLYGMPVEVNPICQDVPRMQVSAEFTRLQHPDLVAKTNAWLKEFFGVHDVVYKFDHPVLGQCLVMGPRTLAQLKAHRASAAFLKGL